MIRLDTKFIFFSLYLLLSLLSSAQPWYDGTLIMTDSSQISGQVGIKALFNEETVVMKKSSQILAYPLFKVHSVLLYSTSDTLEFRTLKYQTKQHDRPGRMLFQVVEENESFSLYLRNLQLLKTGFYLVPIVYGGLFDIGIFKYQDHETTLFYKTPEDHFVSKIGVSDGDRFILGSNKVFKNNKDQFKTYKRRHKVKTLPQLVDLFKYIHQQEPQDLRTEEL
ncbi:MAG: hypothetical protein KI790_09825 [Cyclobacteriaceae bacterium]|nr:hypothetical protein [Cyclobacteriaceae bacterium HetDA_MAG_MS6]